jgi:hypothetical protein
MMTARQAHSSRRVNCTLIAREANQCSERRGSDSGTFALTWAFVLERVTGIETRTVSLGICAIRASKWPDLRGELSVSDREEPRFTGVNGTLMARRSWRWMGLMAFRPSGNEC